MLTVYAAIGFHQTHLEIGVEFSRQLRRRHITLQAIQLPTGAICEVSGRLLSPAAVLSLVRQVLGFAGGGSFIEVAIGIPDSLCRSRIAPALKADRLNQKTIVQVNNDCRRRPEQVIARHQSSGSSKGALTVTASELEIMRYADLFTESSVELSKITPMYITRHNYVADVFSEAIQDQCLLLRICEGACDLALWSGSLPLYQERFLREGTLDSWISECRSRVALIAQRIEGKYSVIARGPEDLTDKLKAGLHGYRVVSSLSLPRELEECLVDTDISLYQAGYFDVALGLLAQLRRDREMDHD